MAKLPQLNTKKRKKTLPTYINEEEFIQILNKVKKNHHKLAFILAFHSGMRISEIINLKKEDIDLKARRIFIRESKGGKDRVVPLPKGFPTSYMKHIPFKVKVRTIQWAFQRYAKLANINKPIHFHSLRHSFAIRCMERGIPLNQIQILLGHENIATTSIYLKINPQDALNKYEELW